MLRTHVFEDCVDIVVYLARRSFSISNNQVVPMFPDADYPTHCAGPYGFATAGGRTITEIETRMDSQRKQADKLWRYLDSRPSCVS